MRDPCNGSRRKNTQLDERVKAAAGATARKDKNVLSKIMDILRTSRGLEENTYYRSSKTTPRASKYDSIRSISVQVSS